MTLPNSANLLDLIQSERDSDLETLLASLGFDFFAVTHIDGSNLDRRAAPLEALETNFSLDWIEHYKSRNFVECDPIVKYSIQTNSAVEWRSLLENGLLSKEQKAVMNEAREFGLRSGVFMSTRQFNGSIQLVSFASLDERSLEPDNLRLASIAGKLAAMRVADKQSCEENVFESPLSERERDCLSWAAIGKSSTDIELIMSISRNTVDFHIKNAMAKLDASTRTFAIVKAIRLGFISP